MDTHWDCMNRIRISLVEDDAGTREGLASLLRLDADFHVMGVHATGEEALSRVPIDRPQVLLMDIQLPGLQGADVVRQLRACMPDLAVLMLTTFEDAPIIFESLRAGANGYVLKKCAARELAIAIRQVHAGGAPMSMIVARKVVDFFQDTPASRIEPEGLSDQENRVLSGLARGKRIKKIASEMGLSESTVRTYVRRIYDKLHVTSQAQAVASFLKSKAS